MFAPTAKVETQVPLPTLFVSLDYLVFENTILLDACTISLLMWSKWTPFVVGGLVWVCKWVFRLDLCTFLASNPSPQRDANRRESPWQRRSCASPQQWYLITSSRRRFCHHLLWFFGFSHHILSLDIWSNHRCSLSR